MAADAIHYGRVYLEMRLSEVFVLGVITIGAQLPDRLADQ